MTRRPPQHSATSEIEFIAETDDAWDRRYAEELDDLEAATGSNDDHPMMAYMSGRTRFDLDAPGTIITGHDDDGEPVMATATPRDYLRPGAEPRVYRCRRMRSLETARCEDIGGSTGEMIACQLALKGIKNPPDGYRFKSRKRSMSDEQLDDLRDAVGMHAITQIGRAAIRASSHPTAAEGKR